MSCFEGLSLDTAFDGLEINSEGRLGDGAGKFC